MAGAAVGIRIHHPSQYRSLSGAGAEPREGPWLGSGSMDILIHLFVALHIIGIASLLGGFLTQMKAMGQGAARFVPAMLHGALTMLITGAVLVGLNQADDQAVNNVKIGVKLALLVVILGLVYVKRDEERVEKGLFGLVGALTTANIFIAVLWT
ncbi:hypothetical protein GCM10010344_24750 [Streptomyces bluensis]|nr:hypothetical protein GCM10010344_24750 [Streptomyces bluensis]